MSVMTSFGFAKCLVEAGVLTQEEANRSSRIVIDCTHGKAVQVYVQRYGEADALAKLAPMLAGMIPAGEDTADIEPPGGAASNG